MATRSSVMLDSPWMTWAAPWIAALAPAAAEPVCLAFRPACLHENVPLHRGTTQRRFSWSGALLAAPRRSVARRLDGTQKAGSDQSGMTAQSIVSRRKHVPSNESPCSTPRRWHAEDIHHTLGNLEFTFLASVLASSSFRVMTKRFVAFLASSVTNLHLCRNMPTFIALTTDLKKGEIITELLNVCKVITLSMRRNTSTEVKTTEEGKISER